MSEPPPITYASAVPSSSEFARDESHLSTLAICHYVWGGLTIAFASIAIIHTIMGIMMLTGAFTLPPPTNGGPAPSPKVMGWAFTGMGGCVLLFGWATGILTIFSGRAIAKRRNRTFSLVMAGINCASFPLGTTLGVFTFIVLLRPTVKQMYHLPA